MKAHFRNKRPSVILELPPDAARAYLLKSESYFAAELPRYFDFGPMLTRISTLLSKTPLADLTVKNLQNCKGINHTILHNKDGQFAWRPQELIHPFLYVELVHRLTEPKSWALIQQRFADFGQDRRFKCTSLPLVSNSSVSDKAAQILRWREGHELASLELSLQFDYMLKTDITDCYGSLCTRAFAPALHGLELQEGNDRRGGRKLLGNALGSLVRSAHGNRTHGLPHDSNLSHLLAELVLGYGDLLISQDLNRAGLSEFKIIRYRDDYRVFAHSRQDCELIARTICNVLRDFGLKLNPGKTGITDEVIAAAIKHDKRCSVKIGFQSTRLIDDLLGIYDLALQHPNSGSVIRFLMEFQKKIIRKKGAQEPVAPMVAILTDIAIRNPRTYPIYAAVLSRMFSWVSRKVASALLVQIQAKFVSVPHTGHLDLWLQRIAIPNGLPFTYSEPLCRTVSDPEFHVWNNDWLQEQYRHLVKASTYVDLSELEPVVQLGEVQLFHYGS
ncbi:hypothetical protein SAMN05428995_1172 [Loktanella sp. DSM 29012]|uniref:RNA-directed DNA polymerase n=1 Tax=Loktanella sp. DSM 29012 TaxID=1881056 RepID=UPI0008C10B73|nr:RNA-directed DNA polymerase [Loktanella sp. DSM 29012]SEQ88994.1 hypothetical protein SAMN05428995_1172 [Loktanella sp. DSM 29012]